MGKDEERKFLKQEPQMANKDAYKKMLNVTVKAVKSSAMMQSHFLWSEVAKIKTSDNTKYCREQVEIENLIPPGGSENCQPTLKCNLSISHIVKSEEWIT